MKYLFVHQNFPGQFHNLATTLGADPRNEVVAIGDQGARPVGKVALHRYVLGAQDVLHTHPFARRFDLECRRAEQVLYLATQLQDRGFTPDAIVVHSGWGENLPLRALFPTARIVVYCEFFYRADGLDVNFDPEVAPLSIDGIVGLQARNACSLIGLAEGDLGIAPTKWQRSTFPPELQRKIRVCHEGIDIELAKPDPDAFIELDDGRQLRPGDEVVTFVCRNLEPLRGYHSFMRALPHVLEARPRAEVLVIGGDGVSYGAPPPEGRSWRDIYFDEVKDRLDPSRLHFLDKVPYGDFLRVLQVSAAHVYLTYPFVLSWSLLEAMAVGCLIVASDTAPVREVIDGRNGVLVDFFDHAALASVIVRMLADPRAFAAMRQQARKTVRLRYNKLFCVADQMRLLTGSEKARARNGNDRRVDAGGSDLL